jgi:DNA-binding beta-propeller fold protein YncE
MINIKTAVIAILIAIIQLQSGTGYRVETRYPVPGNGGFDYVTIDSTARRLYLSHGNQVDVVDPDSGKFIGTIADTPGVHGIALATEFNHGFTSNGRENKVSMFDSTTLQLISKIDVGKGPDGIYYDRDTKRIFTNNHGSHDITAIDAKTGQVIGNLNVKGDGESAVVADGLVYVNLEDTNEVVSFDPKSLQVKNRFPIGVAKTPTGLAYDPKTKRLFIGCRNEPKMVVMNADSGKVITSFPIGRGVDFAGFDPQAKLIFFSCGEGVLNIFREKSADDYEDAGSVSTQPSARTMAFDPKTKKIFLSAAEIIESPATTPGGRPQRSVKPGSFVVIVVSKSQR